VVNMGDDGDIAYRLAHRGSSSFSSGKSWICAGMGPQPATGSVWKSDQ